MYKKIMSILLVFTIIGTVPCYGNNNNFQVGGKSAIVIDVESGRILYEKNIYEKLPMASTTKIMTALLAIENIPLDKKIRVNKQAAGIEGSSIYLFAGEEVKAIDLIYGLMLRSGNDSAAAIAYEVSGSIEDFAKLMNKRAKEIGANNTNFMNPHGLHDDNHYTTSYDLALITREALKNSTFKEVVKTKFWTAEKEGYKHFANKNDILDICEGGDGVKTGYTKRSGRCLVASATRNNMQLIAVTLNDYDWFNTTKKLLDESFNIYRPYALYSDNQPLIKAVVKDGNKKEVFLKPEKNSIIPLKKGEDEKLISVIDIPKLLDAPIKQGEKIGKITTYLNGKVLYSSYLIANESVEKQSLGSKFKKFFRIK